MSVKSRVIARVTGQEYVPTETVEIKADEVVVPRPRPAPHPLLTQAEFDALEYVQSIEQPDAVVEDGSGSGDVAVMQWKTVPVPAPSSLSNLQMAAYKGLGSLVALAEAKDEPEGRPKAHASTLPNTLVRQAEFETLVIDELEKALGSFSTGGIVSGGSPILVDEKAETSFFPKAHTVRYDLASMVAQEQYKIYETRKHQDQELGRAVRTILTAVAEMLKR